MRTLLNLGFGALIAFAILLWVVLMAFSFLVVSFLDFLSWLTRDGLPVTILAALIAIAFGVATYLRRRAVRGES